MESIKGKDTFFIFHSWGFFTQQQGVVDKEVGTKSTGFARCYDGWLKNYHSF